MVRLDSEYSKLEPLGFTEIKFYKEKALVASKVYKLTCDSPGGYKTDANLSKATPVIKIDQTKPGYDKLTGRAVLANIQAYTYAKATCKRNLARAQAFLDAEVIALAASAAKKALEDAAKAQADAVIAAAAAAAIAAAEKAAAEL